MQFQIPKCEPIHHILKEEEEEELVEEAKFGNQSLFLNLFIYVLKVIYAILRLVMD